MKSNMSIVLFAVYFFGLIIFGTSETDDMVPPSVLNLHQRLYDCGFDKFLTGEQLADKDFLDSNYKEFAAAALSAKQLLLDKKFDEGRRYLIKSIRDNTVDNPAINTHQVVQKYFGGNRDHAINLINALVMMFVADVKDIES